MDYLFRGLARNNKIRVFGIDAKESISRVCKQHDTLPLTTVAFARFLLAGIIMGCLEKQTQGITMQINSDGPIKSLFMQASANGLFRGYVGKADGDLSLAEDGISLEKLIGDNGILSVTKTVDNENSFTSDVILMESNITKDIAYYFFTSEQVPTIIDLQVNLDNVEENMKDVFDDFEKLEQIEVKDICDCSKDRFLNSLATLSNQDLEELSTEDIEVVCQFCQKVYTFSKDELQKLKK